MLVKTSKRCKTDDTRWLLREIGVEDISEVEGMSVSEFMDKYSHMHFSNICLDRLLEIGAVHVPEGELLVNELPITTRLKNILLRNDVYVLSDISKYCREEIVRFRNLGDATMQELENLCTKEGIRVMSIDEIANRMEGVRFTYHQLTKMFNMHIWYPKKKRNIEDSLMSFSIASYQTGSVYGKYNRKILYTYIMNDLVVSSLQKGRINCYNGTHTSCCQSCCKSNCMFFRNSYIKKAVFIHIPETF